MFAFALRQAAPCQAAPHRNIITTYTRDNTTVVVKWQEQGWARHMREGNVLSLRDCVLDLSDDSVANRWHEHYFRHAPDLAANDAARCNTITYSSASSLCTFPAPTITTQGEKELEYVIPTFTAIYGACSGLFGFWVSTCDPQFAFIANFMWMNSALFLAHAVASAFDKTAELRRKAKAAVA